MKWIGLVIAICVILFLLLRIYARTGTLQASYPVGSTSGVKDGKLAPCKTSPNCVSSQCDPKDTLHYAESITIPKQMANPKQRLIEIITSMPGAIIVEEDENYIRAEYTTPLMRYVDDVEFLVDSSNRKIEFRSASRVGQSDMGLNRKRIEQIRSQFQLL